MLRSLIVGAVALFLVLATGSALARISGSLGVDLVALARSQLGNGAIYGRHNLWCARFVNWLLEHAGYHGTGSDTARSFLRFPRTSPQVGAIAVLYRKGGGHVGVVTGFDRKGNPVMISGNHGHWGVYESTYPRSRVLAYVAPAEPAQHLARGSDLVTPEASGQLKSEARRANQHSAGINALRKLNRSRRDLVRETNRDVSNEPLSGETNYRTEYVAVLNDQPQGGFVTRRSTVDARVARDKVWDDDGFDSSFERNWDSESGDTQRRGGQHYNQVREDWW